MAPDYTKHKNAELEQLLRARSLPHTGKKADLIARLVQDDADQAAPAPMPPTTQALTTVPAPPAAAAAAPAEDEIDWDDEPPHSAKAPGSKPAPAAPATNPPAIDPSATHDLTVALISPTEEAPAPTFREPTPTLPPVSVETELSKRLARARKYNLPAETVFEAEKALERFRKFGTAPAVQGAVLDGALPERGAAAKKKRGRGEEEGGLGEEGEGEGKSGKRQDSRRREGRGRGRGRSRERGKSGERKGKSGERNGVEREVKGVSEKDRAAAEARKARFGATA
ncbi:hypothetical protein MMC11_006558 [Xylographa trunciseda]|nr:hypothetical protein [Xylographa trunciseda]